MHRQKRKSAIPYGRLVAAMQSGKPLIREIHDGESRYVVGKYSPKENTVQKALRDGVISEADVGLFDGFPQSYKLTGQGASMRRSVQ
jgi:hypothetical protein